MRAYARICSCVASRKCDDAAATLKLGHLVTPGPFLSDAAGSHTNETPFGHWDTLPPLTVGSRTWPPWLEKPTQSTGYREGVSGNGGP